MVLATSYSHSGAGGGGVCARDTYPLDQIIDQSFMDEDNPAERAHENSTRSTTEITIQHATQLWPRHPANPTGLTILVDHDDGSSTTVKCGTLTKSERGLVLKGALEGLRLASKKSFQKKGSTHEVDDYGDRNFDDFVSLGSGSRDIDLSPSADAESFSNCDSTASVLDTEQSSLDLGRFKRRKFESPPPAQSKVEQMKSLIIGDDDAVVEFYRQCLQDFQQNNCKIIAKAWIKTINPNKQTHHPYAGGSKKAPPWWPAPHGNLKPNQTNGLVTHKEPDHLNRVERVTLLTCILKLVTAPSASKAQQMRTVDVARLMQVSNEALGNKLDAEKHSSRRLALAEMFKVAKQQERYRNGEIDASSAVPVRNLRDPGTLKNPDEAGEDFACEDDENEVGTCHMSISTTKTPASETLYFQQNVGPEDFLPPQTVRKAAHERGHSKMRRSHSNQFRSPSVHDQISYSPTNHIPNQVPSHLNSMARESYGAPQSLVFQQEPTRRPALYYANSYSGPASFQQFGASNDPYHGNHITQSQAITTGTRATYLPNPAFMSQSAMALSQQSSLYQDEQTQNGAVKAMQDPKEPSPISHGGMNQVSQQQIVGPEYGVSEAKDLQYKHNHSMRTGYGFTSRHAGSHEVASSYGRLFVR